MLKKLSLVQQQIIATSGLIIIAITGRYLYNYYSGLTMSSFRDKSALYGRELKPGEPPSWP